MTYEDFISRFPNAKPYARGVMVQCPAHKDGTASLAVSKARDGGVVLKCFAECANSEIVKALGLELKDLFASEKARPFKVRKSSSFFTREAKAEKVNYEIDKIYSYTDVIGRELYQAVRLKPKSFRQRHKSGDNWTWNMDGVQRVLYRLPEIENSSRVWIVEGEKDADNLQALGFCGTCNVGGAKKWLDGYSETLKGKEVVICGDNDEPGQEHVQLVYDSLKAVAKWIKIVTVPAPHKDISDLIAACPEGQAVKVINDLEKNSVPHVGGDELPLYSMAELQYSYHSFVTQPLAGRIDLSKWLPSFAPRLRPLTPGTLVLLVGDTGIGKTIILQNIAAVFHDIPRLFFELELSAEDMFERFFANKANLSCRDIESEYQANGTVPDSELNKLFPNLFICPEPGLTLEKFESIIRRSELKTGVKPKIVLADYAQLFRSESKESRYERTSDIAEGLKRIAKATGTVVFLASQVERSSGRTGVIGIHSAKDSGSLENSSGLVIAAIRDEKDAALLKLKVIKATKGGSGIEIDCNLDGEKVRITERAKQPEQDAPIKDRYESF